MHCSPGNPATPALLAVLLVVGCSSSPDVKPNAPDGPPVKRCGTETIRHGKGYDAAARECIWQAYQSREPARFMTTWYTIEGDPVSYRLDVTLSGVQVTVDNNDRFGQRGVFRHACRNFERIWQDGTKERFGFALSGCEGGGATRLAVP